MLSERDANVCGTTPKGNHMPQAAVPPPRASPAAPLDEDEPTPAHIRQALGPTPQRDGTVLGIFDLLSAGTPSKRSATQGRQARHAAADGTPSKPPASTPCKGGAVARTPQPSARRLHLSGSALKRKRGNDEPDTPGTGKRLFTTPAFLRRCAPLREEDGEFVDARMPVAPPFKRKPFVRSLSTIIQGLRKQEAEKMDDEWAVLDEIEAEARGEPRQPAAPSTPSKPSAQPVQPAQHRPPAADADDMPLGPDQAAHHSDAEPSAPDADAHPPRPTKAWKKKGQKRQTRRVIMRPVAPKQKPAPAAVQDESDAEAATRTKGGERDADADADSAGSDSDATPPQPQPQPAATKPKKKVSAQAHANFRALKIKNKNSKAKGKGRFGGRR